MIAFPWRDYYSDYPGPDYQSIVNFKKSINWEWNHIFFCFINIFAKFEWDNFRVFFLFVNYNWILNRTKSFDF